MNVWRSWYKETKQEDEKEYFDYDGSNRVYKQNQIIVFLWL